MKVDELAVGNVSIIEVVPVDTADFDTLVDIRSEGSLQFSDATGGSLLKVGAKAWNIVGADKRSNILIESIRNRNLPRVGWVVSVRPKGQKTEALMLQIHEFPAHHDWPDQIDIGVDDRHVEQVRAKLRRSVTAAEATQWLNERLLLPAADGRNRVFLSGSPTHQTDQRVAFRLHGHGYAVDVARGQDEKLLATRIVEAKRGQTPDERRPVVLVTGRIQFCDATLANAFRGTARTELDQLVERAGSYLNIWMEYNQLERASVLRRARTLGWLRYHKRAIQGNGSWRFYVDDIKALEPALGLLRASDETDLEAAQSPPKEIQEPTINDSAPSKEPASNQAAPRVFVAAFSGADLRSGTLDLQPPVDSEDREPPESGVLFLSVSGDRKRLDRREHAQSLIASAECPMPQLGLLIEGCAVPERRRKAENPLSRAAREVFGGEPTARQVEALRVALNTPDIALIQGPPGTGKTKTIAALEARLAELADEELAGQTLLTSYQHDAVENAASRTLVFGLPAIKVGKKRGTTDENDGFDRWRRETADAVRADLTKMPERPVTAVLRKVRAIAAAYVTSPLTTDESLRVVREIQHLCHDHVSPSLNDRIEIIRQELSRLSGTFYEADDDGRSLALKAVRGLRTDGVSFSDDGPRNAMRALLRLQHLSLYDQVAHKTLDDAANWVGDGEPAFLPELKILQGTLVDLLSSEMRVGDPIVHADLENLLPEIIDDLYNRARETAGGEDSVLYEYLNDLDNDIRAVRDTVRGYTVVLAATCQQSVGYQMSLAKGEDTVFTNVIIDEAARCNPLDLFIPMSLAERRIILVGDHRQLPHILEPDIELQLEKSVTEATNTALRGSLFERLFQAMREREAKDGIKRTVTLDQQYRMHPILGSFVSDTFYAPYGEAFASPREAKEFLHNLPGYSSRIAAWVDLPLSRGPEHGGQSKRRSVEAEWIAKEIERLGTVRPDFSFGVISFYAAQADEVLQAMERRGMSERLDDGSVRVKDTWRETRSGDGHLIERLRVGTVDAFQGKEFDIVFMSMTRSNDLQVTDEKSLRRKFGHLMLENRMCVAMSRQQRLLVVVGDAAMLRGEAAEKALRGMVAFRQLCKGEHGLTIPG
jgi:hypothetical protein